MASIGILVVDDSVVIRRMVATVLGDDPEIDVVGTASNGRIALEKIEQLHPDIIILDVEMPVMDGLATLRALRPLYPTLPVVMFSTSTERGAMATLDALAAGATDYVTKPSNAGSVLASIDRVRLDLIPKIKALVGATRARATPTTVRPPVQPPATAASVAAAPVTPRSRRCLGDRLLDRWPRRAIVDRGGACRAILAVPVVVVQHMPALFTRLFAERLDRSSSAHACAKPATARCCRDGPHLRRAGRAAPHRASRRHRREDPTDQGATGELLPAFGRRDVPIGRVHVWWRRTRVRVDRHGSRRRHGRRPHPRRRRTHRRPRRGKLGRVGHARRCRRGRPRRRSRAAQPDGRDVEGGRRQLVGAAGAPRVLRASAPLAVAPAPAVAARWCAPIRRHAVTTISAGTFTFVADLVKQQAAIVLGPGKEYLVESRLMPLAREAGLDDVSALVARLQSAAGRSAAPSDRRSDDDERDVILPRSRPVQRVVAGHLARAVQGTCIDASTLDLVGRMLERAGALQHCDVRCSTTR